MKERKKNPTHAPVILDEGRARGDGAQVDVGLAQVGHGRQLPDDVVGHQPHEAQSLKVVGPRREDLVQTLQVPLEAPFGVSQRSRRLRTTNTDRMDRKANPSVARFGKLVSQILTF